MERERYGQRVRLPPAAPKRCAPGTCCSSAGRCPSTTAVSREQADQAFDAVGELLAQAGGTFDDVVDLMSFHADARDIPAVLERARAFLPAGREPAWTPSRWSARRTPSADRAARDRRARRRPKRCTRPDAPDWWSPYPVSAACGKGELVFVSGRRQGGADAVTAPATTRSRRGSAFRKIAALAERHGGSLADVVDVLSFHHDPRGMAQTNAVFERRGVRRRAPTEAAALTTIGSPGLLVAGCCASTARSPTCHRARASRAARRRCGGKDLPVSGVTRKPGGRLVGISGQVVVGRRRARSSTPAIHGGAGPLRASSRSATGLELLGALAGRRRRDHRVPQGPARLARRRRGRGRAFFAGRRPGVDLDRHHRPVPGGVPARDPRPGGAGP